jgi:soluble lytic murein transglycosylase
LKGIQMIAEQKIPESYGPRQLVAWYSAHPPVTEAGFYKYVDALNLSGMGANATTAIRARWVEAEMGGDEMTSFYSRFGSLLDGNALWARTDRLLWKNDAAGVRRMLPYLSATDRAVAEARLALANNDRDAESILARVSSDARNDPGLLYQKLRWLVKNNRDSDAEDILHDAPDDVGDAQIWWTQRNILIRRAIERRDFSGAYRLAADHGQTKAKNATEAEFMAGWLALRFLDRPAVAAKHFQGLYDMAGTPVSKARGAYWLGRTYEAAGNRNAAEQAYQDAAAYNTTYYGQLATTRIFANPVLSAKVDPPLPDAARQKIMARDKVRAILRLSDIGEADRARTFFRAAADSAQERAEFVVLAEVAQYMRRPDLGIQAVKAAAQKNMLIHNGGFPLISLNVPTPPEIAFTHAVIRQESLFNPEAGSSAGARGLMQLMPGTARDTARKVGIAYSDTQLLDPETNMRLGTYFLQSLLDKYEGSYILALAGYNAGPGRVREWVGLFGDPRTPEVDPIDWVELIPMSETRNYVQRIMENLQIYRAKLAGGTAPMTIMRDLRR